MSSTLGTETLFTFDTIGIPADKPRGLQTPDATGEWDPPMRDDALLLVAVPQNEAQQVSPGTIDSITLYSYSAAPNGRIGECTANVATAVRHIENDFLPMWEIAVDQPLLETTKMDIGAPGIDDLLTANPRDRLSVSYPNVGDLESRPQFVSDRVIEEYFATEG